MKKTILSIVPLTAVLLLSGLAACSTPSDGTTLTIWAGGQWTGNDAANLNDFIASYNSTHTQQVKVTIKSEFETAFASAVSIGKQPDLVVWDRFNTATYASQDFLYPLDTFIQRDGIDSSIFQEQAYGELTYGGKQYGLPLDLDIWGIYVNSDIVSAYNTAHPDDPVYCESDWTWDDLLDAAKKLTVKRDGSISQAGFSSQDMYEHYFKYMVSTGKDFMGTDGYPDYTGDQPKDTIEFFKSIYQAGTSDNATASKDAFMNGKSAMLTQAVYYSSYLKYYNPDINYKFLPQPKYKDDAGKNGGMIGGFGLAIPNAIDKYNTDSWKARQELAWSFIKSWVCDYDQQLLWSETSNTLPALKSVYSADWIKDTPVLKAASSYADDYECRPGVVGFYDIQVDVYDVYIDQYIKGEGGWTMDTLLTKLNTESHKCIDRYK